MALTGDAAFVVRPHVGAGATKAAIDATVLADCLGRAGEDVAGGLARFESVQLPFGRDIVALSRQQAAYLSAQLKPAAQRYGGELRRDVEALLHAHGTRSDQIDDIVAARGLDVYFRSQVSRAQCTASGVLLTRDRGASRVTARLQRSSICSAPLRAAPKSGRRN